MISNNNKRRRYNRTTTGNKRGKIDYKKSTDRTENKKPKNKRYKKDRPNMKKYKDIRNMYSIPFNVKFNIFGKISYDKKEILKTFGLYSKNKETLKRQDKYYDKKIKAEVNATMKILFRGIDDIKKTELKYIHNVQLIMVPLYFLGFSTLGIKVTFDKKIEKGKSSFTMKFALGDIFSIFKLAQYNIMSFFIKDKNRDELFYNFYDNSLRGFIYEPNYESYGFFLNYKEANRNFANLCINVSETVTNTFKKYTLNETKELNEGNYNNKITDLINYTSEELMKYVVIKNFTTILVTE